MSELELTPMEEAVINAQDFAAGMALSAMVQNLIKKGEESMSVLKDRNASSEDRLAALVESRSITTSLSIVASMQGISGIGG